MRDGIVEKIIAGLCGACLLVVSCASQGGQTRVAPETIAQPPVVAPTKAADPPLVIDDEQGRYEVIQTPFGTYKRPLNKDNAAPPKAAGKQAVSQPSPAPTLKPTKPQASAMTDEPQTPEATAAPAADQPTPTPAVEAQAPEAASAPAPETPVKATNASRPSRPAGKANAPLPVRTAAPATETGDLLLNFDDADLYEVIRTMAELLKINYLIDPNVRGKVTIQTSGRLNKQDLFPIFFQILEANNLTAMKEGKIYKIIPLKDAARMPLPSRIGREGEEIPPGERIVMQIIPLHYIDAGEMTKLLQPFISASGTIISHQDSNSLLLVDKGVNILKALRLVEVFDVDIFEKVQHHFFPLANIGAADAVKMLGDILTGYGLTNKGEPKLIAIERLNMILAISQTPQIFDKLAAFIKQLDVPGDNVEPRIYVYSVKNGAAGELSTLLNQVFGKTQAGAEKTDGKKSGDKEGEPVRDPMQDNPFLQAAQKSEITKTSAVPGSKSGPNTSTLGQSIKITPDEVRNSLIIEATPADYRNIESILHKLDVLPRQVLIEVTIAEILLGDKMNLGVAWNYAHPAQSDTVISQRGGSVGGTAMGLIGNEVYSGLQYMIGQTSKWQSTLNTLAEKSKVNILSSPSVLASDNKEAKINISTEVPVASAVYQTSGSSDSFVNTNIQYRNTGVILSVTPHINERGLVSMDISQEVSETSDNIKVGNEEMPSFFKRSVNTSLTVKHGQTIVIGGLIKQSRDNSDSGVPYLKNIPLLGYLFGSKKNSESRSEMIILITPRVIANLEDVDMVTEEFKNKVSGVSMPD